MDFLYKIPRHLEGHLGDIPDEKLNNIMTVLFEMAINHRLLDYPKLHIEKQVDDITSSMSTLLKQSDIGNRKILEAIQVLASKVGELERVHVPRSTLQEAKFGFDDTEEEDDDDQFERFGEESSEESGDDGLYGDIVK